MTTRTPETIVERRTELLKLEGDGFSRPSIEKQLSQKYQVTVRTVSRDFQIRANWQPSLTHLTDKKQAFYSVLNRYEQIYQKASFTYLHSKNESVTIAALRVMLDALSRIKELANVNNEDPEGDKTYSIRWEQDTDKLIKFSQEDTLSQTMENNEKWRQWTEENCTEEDHKIISAMTSLWIKYEYATNPKLAEGEKLH